MFLCVKCNAIKQPHRFRMVYGKPATGLCRDCESKQASLRIMERLREMRSQNLKGELGTLSRTIDAPHISELCEAMTKKYGGIDAVATAWKSQIDAAASSQPGSKVALDAFRAYMNLVLYSTQNRASAPDVATMSQEELRHEMMEMVLRMVSADDTGDMHGELLNLLSPTDENGVIDAEPVGKTKANKGRIRAKGEGHA